MVANSTIQHLSWMSNPGILASQSSTVEEREKFVAVPVAAWMSNPGIFASQSSTVEEREKFVAVPVAGTRNSQVLQLDGTSGAAGLSPTGTMY